MVGAKLPTQSRWIPKDQVSRSWCEEIPEITVNLCTGGIGEIKESEEREERQLAFQDIPGKLANEVGPNSLGGFGTQTWNIG